MPDQQRFDQHDFSQPVPHGSLSGLDAVDAHRQYALKIHTHALPTALRAEIDALADGTATALQTANAHKILAQAIRALSTQQGS